ncbi:MAG TPA: hypothetical protein VN635_16145 [Conexibacter sp.]|nr:hypothetical protein [Conexibacter sp.]
MAEQLRQRVFGRGEELRVRRIAPEELAWAAAAPAAVLAAAAMFALGPSLGHLLFRAGSDPLWPAGWWETRGHAEPAKHARYLLAAASPLLLAAIVPWSARRSGLLPQRLVRALALATKGLLVAVVAAALIHQHSIVGEAPSQPWPPVFGVASIAAAVAIALALGMASRRRGITERVAAIARETTGRRVAGLAIAVCFVAIWLLKVPLADGSVEETAYYNLAWTLNDAFAVLDGRTPLVDYHAIYAKLLPYPAALGLSVFGTTTIVYTTLMAVLDGLVLVAVYGVFRRLARSSLLAVALFLPFVAVSDITIARTRFGAVSPMTLAALWPMRFGGAYLLAWLTARRLERPLSRHLWLLFFVGGLVAIDNLEFGGGALAATVVALLSARPTQWRREGLRLAGSAAAGLLAAGAAVCLLTLLRAGALPNPALLLEWPRIFADLGWFSVPLTAIGLHLAIYVTFVAALLTGAVRVARRDEDVLLTGMLLWSGVFGLAAGGYFVARPDVYKLTPMVSAWSFALTPLVVVCVRALPSSRGGRPQLAHLLVLFGFALSVTALARQSWPQHQIQRLSSAEPSFGYVPFAEQFVRGHVPRGETVAILLPMSFRIAYDLRLRNVTPYGLENAIVTRRQMDRLLAALRRADVHKVFLPMPGRRVAQEGETPRAHLRLLIRAGYVVGPRWVEPGVMELTRP